MLRNRNGFTLIEASIMLVVFGVVLLFAMAIITPSAKNAQAKQRAKTLEKISRHVMADIAANQTLRGGSNIAAYAGNADYLYFSGLGDNDTNICQSVAIPATSNLLLNIGDDINNSSYTLYNNIAFLIAHRDILNNVVTVGDVTTITLPFPGSRQNANIQAIQGGQFFAVTVPELLGQINCGTDTLTEGLIVPRELPPIPRNRAMSNIGDLNFFASDGGTYFWCIDAPELTSAGSVTAVDYENTFSVSDCNVNAGGSTAAIALMWEAGTLPFGRYPVTIMVSDNANMANPLDQVTLSITIQ